MPPEKPKRRVSFSGSSHERERDPDNEYEEFAESDDEYATNANTAYGHSMYMSLPQVSTSCAFGRSWALLLRCDSLWFCVPAAALPSAEGLQGDVPSIPPHFADILLNSNIKNVSVGICFSHGLLIQFTDRILSACSNLS